jgi:hypothetical protein
VKIMPRVTEPPNPGLEWVRLQRARNELRLAGRTRRTRVRGEIVELATGRSRNRRPRHGFAA